MWAAYDGTRIRLRQSEGKKRVVIPVGAPHSPLRASRSPPAQVQDGRPRRKAAISVVLPGRGAGNRLNGTSSTLTHRNRSIPDGPLGLTARVSS
jgi:hypothetical protein